MSAPESPVPPSRLKRWAPTLVGLAFAGVGLAATGVALSQVEISIRPPEAPTGEPAPVDLLRDDVATIQRDLQDLSGTLGQNLEVLAQGLEGKTFLRGPGEAAFVPRGKEHTFQVIGEKPCRHLVILTPGGFEGFFAEMADRRCRIPEDMGDIVETGKKYHLDFTGPPLDPREADK